MIGLATVIQCRGGVGKLSNRRSYTLTGRAINDRDQALVQAAGVSNTSGLVLYSGGSLTPLFNPFAGRFIFAGA